MADFNYILSFDPWCQNPKASQVTNFVQSHREVESWFIPFVGTIVFKSNRALVDIVPSFREHFAGASFVISLINPSFVGGSLPQSIWDWILERPALGIGSKS